MAAGALSVVAVSPLDTSQVIAQNSPHSKSAPLTATQISKASSALLKHISTTRKENPVSVSKKNLLADEDAVSDSDANETNPDDIPIWLILTTKHHITDKQ